MIRLRSHKVAGTQKIEPTETGLLEFIADELAVPLTTLAERFQIPEVEVGQKLEPLVSRNLVRKQQPSESVVYTITAEGFQQLARSLKSGLLAYL